MKIHILCSITFLRKSLRLRDNVEKLSGDPGDTSGVTCGAYGFYAGLVRLHALMRMYTPMRPGTHMHAQTRKHAHTDQ